MCRRCVDVVWGVCDVCDVCAIHVQGVCGVCGVGALCVGVSSARTSVLFSSVSSWPCQAEVSFPEASPQLL